MGRVLVIAGVLVATQSKVSAQQGLVVDGRPDCVEKHILHQRAAAALGTSDCRASVSIKERDQVLEVHLSLFRGTHQLLSRRYDLAVDECNQLPLLLATVIKRGIEVLPIVSVRASKPGRRAPPAVVGAAAPTTQHPLHLTLRGALVSAWAPMGGDVELGLTSEVLLGDANWIGTGLVGRAGLSRELGQGSYRAISLLGGVSWRYARYAIQPRVLLRAGTTLVVGTGYDDDRSGWLPWLEAGAGISWSFHGIAGVSLEVVSALLEHHVTTLDESDSSTLSMLRVLLSIEVPLWTFFL